MSATLQVYWLLAAIAQDYPKNKHVAELRDHCERAALTGSWVGAATQCQALHDMHTKHRWHMYHMTKTTTAHVAELHDQCEAAALTGSWVCVAIRVRLLMTCNTEH